MDQRELDLWLRTNVDPEIIRAAAQNVDNRNQAPDGFLAAVEKILDAREGQT